MENDETTCDITPETRSAWLDGELNSTRMEEIREHVERCEVCEQHLERLRSVGEAVRNLDSPSAPDSFLTDVRRQIDQSTSAEMSSGMEVNRSDGVSGTSGGTRPERNRDRKEGEETSGDTSVLNRFLVSAAALFLAGAIGFVGYVIGTGESMNQETASSDQKKVASDQSLSRSSEDGEKKAEPSRREDRKTTAEDREDQNRSTESSSFVGKDETEEKQPEKKNAGRSGNEGDRTSAGDSAALAKKQPARDQKNIPESTAGKKKQKRYRNRLNAENRKKRGEQETKTVVLLRIRGTREQLVESLSGALTVLDHDRVHYAGVKKSSRSGPSELAKNKSSEKESSSSEHQKPYAEILNAIRHPKRRQAQIELPYQEALVLLAELVLRDRPVRLRSARRIQGAFAYRQKSLLDQKRDDDKQKPTESRSESSERLEKSEKKKQDLRGGDKREQSNKAFSDSRTVSRRIQAHCDSLRQSSLQIEKTASSGAADEDLKTNSNSSGSSVRMPAQLRSQLQTLKEQENRQFERRESEDAEQLRRSDVRRRILLEWIYHVQSDSLAKSGKNDSGTNRSSSGKKKKTESGTRSEKQQTEFAKQKLQESDADDAQNHVPFDLYLVLTSEGLDLKKAPGTWETTPAQKKSK